MRKEMKILALILSVLLFLVPITTATIPTLSSPKTHPQTIDIIKIVCQVGKQRTIKEISASTIDEIVSLAKEKKESFLTIYNKYSTPEEVEQAFTDVQPFFDSLIANGLTTKSVDEMNTMFYDIRDMIKKPKRDPNGPQPLGGWNGLPTFITGNLACGIFTASVAFGFTVGTHTLLPTIGADLVTVWCGSGETVSIGGLGFTTSTGPESGIILGFLGIMLATPIMITAFLLQIGFAGLYAGFGPSPF